MTESNRDGTMLILRRLREGIDLRNRQSRRGDGIRHRVGQVAYAVQRHASGAEHLAEADPAMSADKPAPKALAASRAALFASAAARRVRARWLRPQASSAAPARS